jgi:hypothetical protein
MDIEIKDGMVVKNNPTAEPVADYVERLVADANAIIASIQKEATNLRKIQEAILFVQGNLENPKE